MPNVGAFRTAAGAVFWGCGLFVCFTAAVAQPDARDILKRSAEAAGGIKRFEELRNFRISTESEIHLETGMVSASITETVELPDKSRQEIKLPAGSRIQVINGDVGWVRIGEDKSILKGSELREMQRGLFRDILHLYTRCNDPGLKLQYMGERNVAGENVHIIRIFSHSSGDFVDLYIDVATSRLIRKSYQGGAEVQLATLEESYSDYREFSGIRVPLVTRVTANGSLFLVSRITSAQFDLKLQESIFEE